MPAKLTMTLLLISSVAWRTPTSEAQTLNADGQDRFMLHANVLIVLKDPFNLKQRLNKTIEAASAKAGHEGTGEEPRSVCEAAEFVQHSTHLRSGIKHGIEYRGYFILSDVMPKNFGEWMIAGDPDKPNSSEVFTHGFLVKKGEKTIYGFSVADP